MGACAPWPITTKWPNVKMDGSIIGWIATAGGTVVDGVGVDAGTGLGIIGEKGGPVRDGSTTLRVITASV